MNTSLAWADRVKGLNEHYMRCEVCRPAPSVSQEWGRSRNPSIQVDLPMRTRFGSHAMSGERHWYFRNNQGHVGWSKLSLIKSPMKIMRLLKTIPSTFYCSIIAVHNYTTTYVLRNTIYIKMCCKLRYMMQLHLVIAYIKHNHSIPVCTVHNFTQNKTHF